MLRTINTARKTKEVFVVVQEMPQQIKDVLSRSGIFRPTPVTEPFNRLAYEQRRAELANRTPGGLQGLDCPLCLNRGYIHTVGDQGFLCVKECKCMVRRRTQRRLEHSGLSDMVERYTFDSWQTPERWQQKFKELAQQYVVKKTGWFLTAGRSGSGKTHLCTAICGRFLAGGLDTRYVLWRDMAVEAKAVVNDDKEYARIVEPLKRVRVLYIDDLLKIGKGQNPTVPDVNLAFEILNSRYNDTRKLTIISTERSIDELVEIDEALGSRIYERSTGYRLDFSQKPNWRLQ